MNHPKSFDFEVELTSQTRDGGYDILAVKRDKLGIVTHYIIECKHPVKNKIGVQPIRELYGVKEEKKIEHAILVTNYYFTQDAWKFSKSPHIWNLYLKDREALLKWIETYKKLKGF
jgi:HJR/Mrr/RecB family endonuclease